MLERGAQYRIADRLRSSVAVALLLATATATAQQHSEDSKFRLRLEYQTSQTGSFDSDFGPIDLGQTDTHAYLLSGVYSLGKRWTFFGTIPYVRKRHRGAQAHDPVANFFNYTAPDLRVVDDGEYHGGFQDLYAGVQYLAIDGPISVSPYISLGTPLSNYPIYGNAIIGKNLWEVPVGVALEFTPHFSDWYFHADISYVFSEKVVGVDLNYWLWTASASYFVTRRFSPTVFISQRTAPNALTLNDFSDADWDSAKGFHHDQILKHSYINGGIGFNYVINDNYSIAASYYETIDQDQVAKVKSAYTFAVTYRF